MRVESTSKVFSDGKKSYYANWTCCGDDTPDHSGRYPQQCCYAGLQGGSSVCWNWVLQRQAWGNRLELLFYRASMFCGVRIEVECAGDAENPRIGGTVATRFLERFRIKPVSMFTFFERKSGGCTYSTDRPCEVCLSSSNDNVGDFINAQSWNYWAEDCGCRGWVRSIDLTPRGTPPKKI